MHRVLLVVDVPDDLEIYGVGLRSLAFEVIPAGTPEAAKTALRVQPDVVVLDLGLGEHWTVCDQLGDASPDLPIVCLTAAIRPDGANRLRARATPNCAAFVGKPCTHLELAAVIQRVAGGERDIVMTAGSQVRWPR